MATSTYYFDGSDSPASDNGSSWSGVTNADDGNTSTSASTTDGDSSFLSIGGTNAPSSGGTITQVRVRAYGADEGNINDYIDIHTDGFGEFLAGFYINVASIPGWSSYTTLNTPTGGWTWAKVQALEARAYTSSIGPGPYSMDVRRIEIEVTYTPTLAPDDISFVQTVDSSLVDLGKRYWVGGTGTWSDDSHWAYTSGGPGGAPHPTYSEDPPLEVYFDANSFTANGQVVTFDTDFWCKNFYAGDVTYNVDFLPTNYQTVEIEGNDFILSDTINFGSSGAYFYQILHYPSSPYITGTSGTVRTGTNPLYVQRIYLYAYVANWTTNVTSSINLVGLTNNDVVYLQGNVTANIDFNGNDVTSTRVNAYMDVDFTGSQITTAAFNHQNGDINGRPNLTLDVDLFPTTPSSLILYSIGVTTTLGNVLLKNRATLHASTRFSAILDLESLTVESGVTFLELFGNNTTTTLLGIANLPANLTLQIRSTTTVNAATWNFNSTPGDPIHLQSSSTTTQANIESDGGSITGDYLIVDDINASSANGTLWYAGTDFTDNGNSSGWIYVTTANDTSSALTLDSTAIIQNHRLSTDDIGFISTVDNTGIIENYNFSANDINIVFTIDTSVAFENYPMLTDNVSLTSLIDSTTITQNHLLATQDILFEQSLEASEIVENIDLSPDDISFGVTTDNTDIVENVSLSPSDVNIDIDIYGEEFLLDQNGIQILDEEGEPINGESSLSIFQDHVLGAEDINFSVEVENTIIDRELAVDNISFEWIAGRQLLLDEAGDPILDEAGNSIYTDGTQLDINFPITPDDISFEITTTEGGVVNTNHYLDARDVYFGPPRKDFFFDSEGNIYWVVDHNVGLVEKI